MPKQYSANLNTDTGRELSRQEGESRECEIDFATNGRQHRRHGAFVISPVLSLLVVEYLTRSQGTKCATTSSNGSLLQTRP
jgi:hypothetical protein